MTETALQPWQQMYTVLMKDDTYYVVNEQQRDAIASIANSGAVLVQLGDDLRSPHEIRNVKRAKREDYLLRDYPRTIQRTVGVRIERYFESTGGKFPSEETITTWAERAKLGETL